MKYTLFLLSTLLIEKFVYTFKKRFIKDFSMIFQVYSLIVYQENYFFDFFFFFFFFLEGFFHEIVQRTSTKTKSTNTISLK